MRVIKNKLFQANELAVVSIEIQNRWVNIYEAQLRFQADFTGIKYIMYHHPLIALFFAAVFGVGLFGILLGAVWNSIGKGLPNKEKNM